MLRAAILALCLAPLPVLAATKAVTLPPGSQIGVERTSDAVRASGCVVLRPGQQIGEATRDCRPRGRTARAR